MKDKRGLKKIAITLVGFAILSFLILQPMKQKIEALEDEKNIILEDNEEVEYHGDAYDKEHEKSLDEVVLKIIANIDPSIEINFINKYDLVDEDNNPYTSIELSVSGDINKVKEIEGVLNDLKLNYTLEDMDIKNRKNESGDNVDNYVDCVMTFKVK